MNIEVSITVAIPTKDRGDKICQTIRSILCGTVLPDEILVSDQSNNNNTYDAVAKMQSEVDGKIIRYVSLKGRKGLSANRNDVIKETQSDFLIFLDDDMEVEKEWLSNLMEEWIVTWNKKPVIISGMILPGDEFEDKEYVPSIRTSDQRKVYLEMSRDEDIFYGAYFGASTELFKSLGEKAFDEQLGVGADYPAAEDDDFAYRVLKAGIPIVYEPKIVASHHPLQRSWRKMRYNYSIGGGAFFAKHLLAGDFMMLYFFVKTLATNFLKFIKAIIFFKEPEGSARLFACFGLSLGFFKYLFSHISRR